MGEYIKAYPYDYDYDFILGELVVVCRPKPCKNSGYPVFLSQCWPFAVHVTFELTAAEKVVPLSYT